MLLRCSDVSCSQIVCYFQKKVCFFVFRVMKRPNQEFLPKPNRTEPPIFFCRTKPSQNFGRFLTHTRKRPNQEFLPNPNRTEPPIFFAEPNRNFGRFLFRVFWYKTNKSLQHQKNNDIKNITYTLIELMFYMLNTIPPKANFKKIIATATPL